MEEIKYQWWKAMEKNREYRDYCRKQDDWWKARHAAKDLPYRQKYKHQQAECENLEVDINPAKKVE